MERLLGLARRIFWGFFGRVVWLDIINDVLKLSTQKQVPLIACVLLKPSNLPKTEGEEPGSHSW